MNDEARGRGGSDGPQGRLLLLQLLLILLIFLLLPNSVLSIILRVSLPLLMMMKVMLILLLLLLFSPLRRVDGTGIVHIRVPTPGSDFLLRAPPAKV